MSDEEVVSAKCRILEIFSNLNDMELESIEKWICSQSYKKDLETKKSLKMSSKLLNRIGESIKKMIPFEAEMPTERIMPPRVGDQTDCNKDNTCHVDGFLYDEKQVEELVIKGKLKRQYCLDCSSRNIKAYHFSNAAKVVGIEMNKECCEVQEKIIAKYLMDMDRISVINSDVLERQDIVECSDIIIINVLDFFVDEEKHRELWYFFKKHIKRGSYLIANRSMAETLGFLGIFEEFMDWLNICKPNQIENEIFFDVEDYSELYLYSIN